MTKLRAVQLGVWDAVKRVLRPVAQQRRRIEQVQYRGRRILGNQAGNDFIAASLASGRPAAIGKIGGTEILVLNKWLRHGGKAGDIVHDWAGTDERVHKESGVYPVDDTVVSRFAETFLNTLREVDILAAWYRPGEASIVKKFAPQAQLVELAALEPYYHERPWSAALAGKRVLVFTPFAQSVERQYARRKEVWAKRPDLLPDFELKTIRAPLYPHMIAPSFPTWFDAMEEFKRQFDAVEYDVVITGAGAWSVPLAVHARRTGRWGIHLGGSTQILFGIKGRRWDKSPQLMPYFNDVWVRPSDDEKPSNFREMENGCYW